MYMYVIISLASSVYFVKICPTKYFKFHQRTFFLSLKTNSYTIFLRSNWNIQTFLQIIFFQFVNSFVLKSKFPPWCIISIILDCTNILKSNLYEGVLQFSFFFYFCFTPKDHTEAHSFSSINEVGTYILH